MSHDAVAPWTTLPLYANEPDAISIGVTPVSNAPPGAITDLLASANPTIQGQIALTWTAPQGNVGGVPINNQIVAAYIVHYATFSVASMSGDTAGWWNASSTTSVMLQPPDYVPKPPGQLEGYTFTGLTPGATYFFGVESISLGGIFSPIDSESASPNSQASAVATKFSSGGGGSTGTPMNPSGLSASSSGGQFTLNWHPVTLDTNEQSITIDHYVVTRYAAIGSSPTVTTNIPASALSYTDTVGGLTYYYRVLAVSAGGAASAPSDYVDSSSQLNHYYVAPDDITTRVVVPNALALELNSGNNVYGEDLEIILTRRPQDEVNLTLRSYHVGVYMTTTGVEIPAFAFSTADMQVQLGLGSILSGPPLNQVAGRVTSGSIAQIVSVYWFNGASYIKISDPELTSASALSVSVKNVGTYQVRTVQVSTQFQLMSNSPYPRVITPNDPAQNNRVFWFFDNPSGNVVSGTIYDIRGAKVRDLVMNGDSPTSNSIVWNGRDNNGAVVRSGVYIYKITSGNEKVTGTVVVAR